MNYQMLCRCSLIFIYLVLSTSILTAQDAQAVQERYREQVILNTDTVVEKKLRSAAEYLSDRQWKSAVSILQQIADSQGDKLIRLHPQQFVTVANYCNRMIAPLPEEALQVYRMAIDPLAREWFRQARTQRDRHKLKQLLQRAFASSFGDDALLLLGEMAWERGDPAIARSYWEQLIPFPRPVEPGVPLPVLRYPDSDIKRADILARLVLCSIAEGNSTRATLEWNAFEKQFPDATGVLAGKRGKLSALLKTELNASSRWKISPPDASLHTFGFNGQRNGLSQSVVELKTVRWKLPLPYSSFGYLFEDHQFTQRKPLTTFPVMYKDILFVNGDDRVQAYNLNTGKPWPDPKDHSPLYPLRVVDQLLPEALPTGTVVGIPRHTMTVHHGYLYAKLGTPITARSKNEQQVRELKSNLVCLDLDNGEGKLVWKVAANSLAKPGMSEWTFEGAPLLHGGRLYIALRRSEPQTEFSIACFYARTGKLLWQQQVCSSVSPVSRQYNLISHLLLTYGNGTLFLSTNSGAIAAVDAEQGTIRWVVTYPGIRPASADHFNNDRANSLTPCLYQHGCVIAAPNDSESLIAIDARSGEILWQRKPRGGVEHLLGVGRKNTLIVSGQRLYGLDILSGNIRWQLGYEDPEGFGYGRGLLAKDVVYWPLREEILVVDQYTRDSTGNIRQRIPIKRLHGEETGNLFISQGKLLIAQPRHLLMFNRSDSLPLPKTKIPPKLIDFQ